MAAKRNSNPVQVIREEDEEEKTVGGPMIGAFEIVFRQADSRRSEEAGHIGTTVEEGDNVVTPKLKMNNSNNFTELVVKKPDDQDLAKPNTESGVKA